MSWLGKNVAHGLMGELDIAKPAPMYVPLKEVTKPISTSSPCPEGFNTTWVGADRAKSGECKLTGSRKAANGIMLYQACCPVVVTDVNGKLAVPEDSGVRLVLEKTENGSKVVLEKDETARLSMSPTDERLLEARKRAMAEKAAELERQKQAALAAAAELERQKQMEYDQLRRAALEAEKQAALKAAAMLEQEKQATTPGLEWMWREPQVVPEPVPEPLPVVVPEAAPVPKRPWFLYAVLGVGGAALLWHMLKGRTRNPFVQPGLAGLWQIYGPIARKSFTEVLKHPGQDHIDIALKIGEEPWEVQTTLENLEREGVVYQAGGKWYKM